MASDTVWVETHKALNSFMKTLTCTKCNQRLRNPQQFLNCGHYSCAKCVGCETDCVICNIPGEVSDIYADREINDLLSNLEIVAEAVGLSKEKDNEGFEVPRSPKATSTSSSNKNVRKRSTKKTAKMKSINETMNTSICESTISKSSLTVPKNIDKKNRKGETPLHIACRNNNDERVKLLLDNKANPNTKDNAGWTPLQEAASYNYFDICEMLLKAGASPNMIGFDNRTALHEAVIVDNCDLVSLLINNNASRDLCDKEGKKPKDYCKSKKMANFIKSLQDLNSNKSESSYDVTLNINKTINTLSDGKIVLFASHLSLKNRKLLMRLNIERKIKVVNNLSPHVTHVIIESDAGDNIVLTFDVLLTILYGKRFLNSDCLPILLDDENICSSNLSVFEINPPQLDDGPTRARENMEKQNPKLFNNCFFFFAVKSNDCIKYDGVNFTKDNLMKLVGLGDGILLTREPRPEDIQGSLSPFHVAHDPKHSLYKCTHYIIYVPDNNSSHSNANRIIYNMPNLKTLPLMWFIESILRYKLLDPVSIGLVPE